MHYEEGHHVVRCSGQESLHRANSLVNIQFSWFLIGIAVFGVCLYLVMVKVYGQENEKVEYFSLGFKGEDEEDTNDVESQKKSNLRSGTSKSFIEMGKSAGFGLIDVER